MNTLQKLSLSGFKSIKQVDGLEFGPLNVLIGANGSGKSNLISFFQMLNYAMTGGLRQFVAVQGGASSLLHFGPKRTSRISAEITFKTFGGTNTYAAQLTHAAGDTLIFVDEEVSFQRDDRTAPQRIPMGVGHQETKLNDPLLKAEGTVGFVRGLLTATRVYQFHDTSSESRMRLPARISDNRWLFSDGGNLPALLYRLQQREPHAYERIVSIIRQAAPFFHDFALEPDLLNPNIIELRWMEKGAPEPMGPHQLSDGTLRFTALTTLLCLPPQEIPRLLIIDEPELGLHPSAVVLFAEIVSTLRDVAQVFVSTQSVTLLNRMAPEDVLVAERVEDGGSIYRRLDAQGLAGWLEDYGMGELWEKNVLGGRP